MADRDDLRIIFASRPSRAAVIAILCFLPAGVLTATVSHWFFVAVVGIVAFVAWEYCKKAYPALRRLLRLDGVPGPGVSEETDMASGERHWLKLLTAVFIFAVTCNAAFGALIVFKQLELEERLEAIELTLGSG